MALTIQEIVQELQHEINSPLAAIRNALYLAALRTADPETLRYLDLAESEITRISAALNNANQTDENKRLHLLDPRVNSASAA